MKPENNTVTSRTFLVMSYGDGGVGDHLVCSPFVRNLAQNYPGATIDFGAFSTTGADLFKYNPYIRNSFVIDMNYLRLGTEYGCRERIRFITQYRKQRYDTVYVLGTKFRHAVFAYLIGAKKRIGYGNHHRGFLLTHAGEEPIGKHVVERYLGLLALDGQIVLDPNEELFLSDREVKNVERIFRENEIVEGDTVIAIAPCSAVSWKTWGLDRFWETAGHFVQHGQRYKVVILGSSADWVFLNENPPPEHPSLINLVGKLTILETAAAIKNSALFLGNDSGLGHIAGAVGTKALILGNYITHSWYPLAPQVRTIIKDAGCTAADCNPCSRTGNTYRKCFSSISVQEVIESLERMAQQNN